MRPHVLLLPFLAYIASAFIQDPSRDVAVSTEAPVSEGAQTDVMPQGAVADETTDQQTNLEASIAAKMGLTNVFASTCNDVLMNMALDNANKTYVCQTAFRLDQVGATMQGFGERCSKANQATLKRIAVACDNTTQPEAGSEAKGYSVFDQAATAIACSQFPAHPFLKCDKLPKEASAAYNDLSQSAEPAGPEAAPWLEALEKTAEHGNRGCETRKEDTIALVQHFDKALLQWQSHHRMQHHAKLLHATRSMYMAMNDLVTCICDSKMETLVPVLACYKHVGESVANTTAAFVVTVVQASGEEAGRITEQRAAAANVTQVFRDMGGYVSDSDDSSDSSNVYLAPSTTPGPAPGASATLPHENGHWVDRFTTETPTDRPRYFTTPAPGEAKAKVEEEVKETAVHGEEITTASPKAALLQTDDANYPRLPFKPMPADIQVPRSKSLHSNLHGHKNNRQADVKPHKVTLAQHRLSREASGMSFARADESLASFTTGDAHGFSSQSRYVGCFKDDSSRDLPVNTPNVDGALNPVLLCERQCRRAGKRYFGLQDSNQCWCGDVYGTKGGAATNCNLPCKGNNLVTCGGPWANSVYEILNPDIRNSPSSIGEYDLVRSLDGKYFVQLQDDRNIAMYRKTDLWTPCIWTSNTNTASGSRPYKLEVQSDGNLVGYDANGNVFFASNTWGRGQGPYQFAMGDDGRVSMSDANEEYLWSDGYTRSDWLTDDQVLNNGGRLMSFMGRAKLELQDDRNIVLSVGSRVVWSSGTANGGANQPYRLVMQTDGNLVAYDNNNSAFWSTNTYDRAPGPYKAIVQDDGNFVLYDDNGVAMWQTNTAGSLGFKSVGCFKDTNDRDLPDGPYNVGDSNQPEDTCRNVCYRKGHIFFAIQARQECWCGGAYGKHGAAGEWDCAQHCPVANWVRCGAGWRNSVYEITPYKEEESGARYIGCYKDGADRDLNGPSFTVEFALNPVQHCAYECRRLSHQYFGLQDGKQCFCGNSYGKYGGRLMDQQCDASCAANPSVKCGGSYVNSVYEALPAPLDVLGYKYLGCFLEGATRDLPDFGGDVGAAKDPEGWCADQCRKKGKKYMGLQFGQECWCGNTYGQFGSAPASDCSKPCRSNRNVRCGNGARNSIYEITASSANSNMLPGGVNKFYPISTVLESANDIFRSLKSGAFESAGRQAWETLAAVYSSGSLLVIAQKLQYSMGSPCQLYPLKGENKALSVGGSINNALHGEFGCGQDVGPVDLGFKFEFWIGNKDNNPYVQLENEVTVGLAGAVDILEALSALTSQASSKIGWAGSALNWVVNKILGMLQRKLATGEITLSLAANDFYFSAESAFYFNLLPLPAFKVEVDPKVSLELRSKRKCPQIVMSPGIRVRNWQVQFCESCKRFKIFGRRFKICVWYPCGSSWNTIYSYYPFGNKKALTHDCGTELP